MSVEGDPAEVPVANAHRRASNRGYPSKSLDDYLRILNWTDRQIHRDKRGAISRDLAPILDRVGMCREWWVETVPNVGLWVLGRRVLA